MLYNEIQTKIWELSVSTGLSPYTFISFKVDEQMKTSVAEDYLDEYSQGIAFFIWEDYTLEDYKDYLKNSKEYILITDNQKNDFLIQQVTKNIEQMDFLNWQHNQMYIAVGFALNELKNKKANYKEVENIAKFKQTLKVNKAVLCEAILF